LILFQTTSAQKKKKIQYKSGVLYTTEELGPDIKVLIDSVVFTHENAKMYCDSALFNPSANFFDAFGNIKVVKPTEERDTVFLYGDTLRYDGDKKLASVRNRVSLLNDSLRLFTDSLDYDLQQDMGYYFDGGITINGDDTISSNYGYYYATQNEFFFKENVVVNNPRFEMYSDTLKHNTEKHISYFFGPSEIFSDENYIYCEDGWYNHDKHLSRFKKNALLRNEEQAIEGQLIVYDRNKGVGEAYTDVTIRDSTQNIILTGNYGYYNEQTDYSLMTDSAVFIQITDTDSLYLHADTIRSFYVDSEGLESTKKEENETYRIVQAYHKTKIFKTNFQAKCDSLVYTFRDSVMELHSDPVIWSEDNQLTADYIYVLTRNSEVEQVNMEENAFIISQTDSLRFNQIKGNRMIGFVEKRQLVQINVYEQGESLYFLKDDNDLLIGSNRITCKDMKIYLKDDAIDRIWFYENPKALMKPPNSLSQSESKLPGFRWEDKQRPKNKYDIFVWKETAPEENSNKETESSETNSTEEKPTEGTSGAVR
jgi:lipopolysaccharide export system protein LptA